MNWVSVVAGEPYVALNSFEMIKLLATHARSPWPASISQNPVAKARLIWDAIKSRLVNPIGLARVVVGADVEGDGRIRELASV